MSDFSQMGVVTTLHRLGRRRVAILERQLGRFSEQQPIALVLPALYSEFEKPAMEDILRELSRVRYIQQFVVTVAGARPEQFREVQRRLAVLPAQVRVIWNDGPRLQQLYRMLERNGLQVGPNGKGRSCWMAYGYVLACRRANVIALHDCDIVNYRRELLVRLCYPVVNPNIKFDFCKGYYARVSDRMHGRVTRLLMTPLVRALLSTFGYLPFLVYLDSFRYPLAGEFAMKTRLAHLNRMPSNWGLEVGVLAETYRNCSLKRVCQVDIADNYEHKHQDLSPNDPTKGLMKMAVDIAKTLFQILSGEGLACDSDGIQTLLARYVHAAKDTITRCHADAMINGLIFDRHAEETAVETFAHGLKLAAEDFFASPMGMPMIPSWSRVSAVLPGFLGALREAVDADNCERSSSRAEPTVAICKPDTSAGRTASAL